MKEGDLCPKCEWGHLHFEGLVCNHCGYKQKAEHRSLDENVPVGDKESGTVRRIDPEDKIEE